MARLLSPASTLAEAVTSPTLDAKETAPVITADPTANAIPATMAVTRTYSTVAAPLSQAAKRRTVRFSHAIVLRTPQKIPLDTLHQFFLCPKLDINLSKFAPYSGPFHPFGSQGETMQRA